MRWVCVKKMLESPPAHILHVWFRTYSNPNSSTYLLAPPLLSLVSICGCLSSVWLTLAWAFCQVVIWGGSTVGSLVCIWVHGELISLLLCYLLDCYRATLLSLFRTAAGFMLFSGFIPWWGISGVVLPVPHCAICGTVMHYCALMHWWGMDWLLISYKVGLFVLGWEKTIRRESWSLTETPDSKLWTVLAPLTSWRKGCFWELIVQSQAYSQGATQVGRTLQYMDVD